MPEQMVSPGARLAERVHVGATEEIGLHVHLLDMELVLENALAHELMARVEAARVADHGDKPASLLLRDHGFRVLQTVGEWNLNLHMLAGLEALKRLRGVHLRWRRKNHRIEPGQLEGVGEVCGDMSDVVFCCRLPGLVELTADQRDRLDSVDQFDRVEVSKAEGAGAGKGDFDGVGHEGLRKLEVSPDRHCEERSDEAIQGS